MAGRASSKGRVEQARAWLLHSYPYKETSLICEIFARDFGRIALVARGARRPTSALRGSLLGFAPLQLSWFGTSELKTLHSAEWQGGVSQLSGLPLLCGFYLNELLLKLLPREDAHAGLFDAYSAAIVELAKGMPVEPILRRFERKLLSELGYGLSFSHDAQGLEIAPDQVYGFVSGHGLIAHPGTQGSRFTGEALLAMAQDDYREAATCAQAKQLLRGLLTELLGETPLHTRQILRDLHQL